MKIDFYDIAFYFMVTIITVSFLVFFYFIPDIISPESVRRKAFNKVHGLHITKEEWLLYHDKIEEQYEYSPESYK
jgi:hypothetical protein